MCACVRACVRVRVCACVRACVCVCVCVCDSSQHNMIHSNIILAQPVMSCPGFPLNPVVSCPGFPFVRWWTVR